MAQEQTPTSWALYFCEEPFNPEDRRVNLIEALCHFLLTEPGWDALSQLYSVLNTSVVVPIDYAALCERSNIADLVPAMEMQPAECLGCLGAACYEVLFETDDYHTKVCQVLGYVPVPQKIQVHPYNVPNTSVHIKSIQSSYIGRLVTVTGTVVRMSPAQPLATSLDYRCNKCNACHHVKCPDGKPKPPDKCGSEGCKSKSFKPVAASIAAVDWQKFRLQELLSVPQQGGAGSAARTIEVEATAGCCNQCKCGDSVTALGFVRVMAVDSNSKSSAQSGVMLLYLQAVSLVTHHAGDVTRRPSSAQVTSHTGSEAACDKGARRRHLTSIGDHSVKDLHFIATYTRTVAPDQLLHLAASLCPSILGHHAVKLGIVLALLSGPPQHEDEADAVAVRGAAHVLLAGDPGLGKSALLRAAAEAAPWGVYVSSMTTTAAGLTVSVTRDVVTNDMVFEAGALALADEGVCCLDELDNMGAQHRTLLEVMEQQQISVAKAGLTAQMPARTTIIAAANPIGGTYNRGRTLRENLKMSDALLSRFDLIFAMLDEADEAHDIQVSEHILKTFTGQQLPTASAPLALPGPSPMCTSRPPLQDRAVTFSCNNPLPAQLMRHYIAYSKQNCHPKLSPKAKHVLKQFYLDVRQQAAASPGLPVTARILESLVRLAEARARADLRTIVTADDAADVLDLMRCCLRDFFRDGVPFIALQDSNVRSRSGKASEMQRLMQALRQQKSSTGKKEVSVAEVFVLADKLGIYHPVSEMIDKLNECGELLKKGPQLYAVA